MIARTSIAGDTFADALRDHFRWAYLQFVGTLLLLAPFLVVALICAALEREARTRSAALIFAVSMLTLSYFYFEGHLGAQHAILEEKRTAAILSIGLLPFFIGIPVVLGTLIAGALVAKFDKRQPL